MKGRKEHEMKEKHEGKREKRADGGMLHDPIDEKERAHKKIKVTKKAGGKVEGKEPMKRLDRRARGGANSDTSPFTAAAKMSEPSYEHGDLKAGSEAEGKDRPTKQ